MGLYVQKAVGVFLPLFYVAPQGLALCSLGSAIRQLQDGMKSPNPSRYRHECAYTDGHSRGRSPRGEVLISHLKKAPEALAGAPHGLLPKVTYPGDVYIV